MAVTTSATATDEDVRPFTFDVSDEQLDDLRRRITATQWPDRETDPTQGVALETMQCQHGRIVGRTFEITFLDAGAQAYVFTFG